MAMGEMTESRDQVLRWLEDGQRQIPALVGALHENERDGAEAVDPGTHDHRRARGEGDRGERRALDRWQRRRGRGVECACPRAVRRRNALDAGAVVDDALSIDPVIHLGQR